MWYELKICQVNPNLVEVPTDYPNNDVFKKVVAQHYDAIRMDDSLIGQILIGLRKAGLEKNNEHEGCAKNWY